MGYLTYEQPSAVFPEGYIVKKPHHCNFPRHRGGNQSWINETAVCSATTTLQQYTTSNGTQSVYLNDLIKNQRNKSTISTRTCNSHIKDDIL